MSAQLDEEFRDFMHGRWRAMVRLAYGLTGDQGHAASQGPRIRGHGEHRSRCIGRWRCATRSFVHGDRFPILCGSVT